MLPLSDSFRRHAWCRLFFDYCHDVDTMLMLIIITPITCRHFVTFFITLISLMSFAFSPRYWLLIIFHFYFLLRLPPPRPSPHHHYHAFSAIGLPPIIADCRSLLLIIAIPSSMFLCHTLFAMFTFSPLLLILLRYAFRCRRFYAIAMIYYWCHAW